jgi:aspartate/methionine/tyrosine aminotransferase
LDIAKKHKLTLISDEIYERYVFLEDKKFTSLTQFYENNSDVDMVIVSSPSKTFGMIGDRIGYIVGN